MFIPKNPPSRGISGETVTLPMRQKSLPEAGDEGETDNRHGDA